MKARKREFPKGLKEVSEWSSDAAVRTLTAWKLLVSVRERSWWLSCALQDRCAATPRCDVDRNRLKSSFIT